MQVQVFELQKRAYTTQAAVEEISDRDGMPRYPDLSAPGLLRAMDYVGTVAFALSGCVTAGVAGMDLLGCLIVATITSVGGGTVRDLLIGNSPVFWVEETEYLVICILVALGTFFLWSWYGGDDSSKVLFWADTIGVGAFCVIGAQNGIRKNLAGVVCVCCGMFTATFGGVIRDVLCNRPVRIMHSHAEVYATTALAGASAYVLAKRARLPLMWRISSGFGTAVVLRYLATAWDIKLPTFTPSQKHFAQE
jgi:uncharacterized membrane protein YeiH